MAITQPFSGTLTAGTTELSLISGTSTLQASNTAGIYQLMLDLSAMQAGDQYQISIKEAVLPAGTQRLMEQVVLSGPQNEPNYVSPSLILMNAWDMTLQLLQGVARSVPYSIRQVA